MTVIRYPLSVNRECECGHVNRGGARFSQGISFDIPCPAGGRSTSDMMYHLVAYIPLSVIRGHGLSEWVPLRNLAFLASLR